MKQLLLCFLFFQLGSTYFFQPPPGIETHFLKSSKSKPQFYPLVSAPTTVKSLTTLIEKPKKKIDQNEIDQVNAEKEHKKKLSDILPLVTFDCHDRAEGYYADIQFRCEVFHYCGKPSGKRFTFFCPPGSRFNQIHMICDYAMFQGCDKSEDYFHLNDKLYPKDENVTEEEKNSVYGAVTFKPIALSTFGYESVKSSHQTTTTTSEKPHKELRRWTIPMPQRPMVIRLPPRMGQLEASGSHLPITRVAPPPMRVLNPHLIGRMRPKSNKKKTIHVPVPVLMPRRRQYVSPLRSSLREDFFPPAHQFRRRPLPPPEMLYDFDEPPSERMEKKKSYRDDWRRGLEVEEDEELRMRNDNRRMDKWGELDKAAAQWRLGDKRRDNEALNSESSDSESSEEDVTTTTASKKKFRKTTTTTHKPMTTKPKRRIQNTRIGGRLNSKTTTTTTLKPTTTTTTTTAIPTTIDTTTTAISTTTPKLKAKPKHRFTKVQRSRIKSTTSTLSPTSFTITIKPVATPHSSTQTNDAVASFDAVASALVASEDNNGENEKSYI